MVDKVYKQKQKIKMIIMIGAGAGGGALIIIASIAICCCLRKKKKKNVDDGGKIENMESTLSEYGHDWESSESSDDDVY